MKKVGSLLEDVSCKVVCAMAVILLTAFTYWAGIYTHMPNVDLENAKVRLYQDDIFLNLLWLFITAGVFFILSGIVFSKEEGKTKKRIRILATIASAAVGIIGIIWVTIHPYEPYHDQLQVVADALDFRAGDFTDLKGYLEIYPQQLGLVFIYELIFNVWPSSEAVCYFNVIWLMTTVYFTYAVSEELFENNHVSLYSIFTAVFFVPMYFYVNYAYGDLSMAACGILGLWLLIRFCKTEQNRYAVMGAIVMVLSYLMRKNSMIIIIAMTIMLGVRSIKKSSRKMLVYAMLLFTLPICAAKGVESFYEARADMEMVDGAPAVLTIAMGMQDTYEGPGYYNAYSLMTYVNADKDAAVSAKIGKTYVMDRLKEMGQDLPATKEFYQVKIWQQWNEPAFSGEISTNTFETTPRNFVLDIYYGAIQEFLRIFRNRYLFILYAGACICAWTKLFTPKGKDSIWKNTIWIVLIGGFLFSLLWESKSRYVMPYVAMLMPCSAYGLYQLQNGAGKVTAYIKKKITKA